MKAFIKAFTKAVPFAIGVVLSLLSVAYTVMLTDSNSEETLIAAIVLGLIGYPILIASIKMNAT